MDEKTRARINSLLEEIYRLINPETDQPEQAPANVTPIKPDETDVELEGVIGRPELKVVRGKTRFTAGLGVQEGAVTRWENLVAWGDVTTSANTIQRGRRVRVVAKPKETAYVDSHGVMQSKRELTASVISPVNHAVGAISANTLSRERRNGTT